MNPHPLGIIGSRKWRAKELAEMRAAYLKAVLEKDAAYRNELEREKDRAREAARQKNKAQYLARKARKSEEREALAEAAMGAEECKAIQPSPKRAKRPVEAPTKRTDAMEYGPGERGKWSKSDFYLGSV